MTTWMELNEKYGNIERIILSKDCDMIMIIQKRNKHIHFESIDISTIPENIVLGFDEYLH